MQVDIIYMGSRSHMIYQVVSMEVYITLEGARITLVFPDRTSIGFMASEVWHMVVTPHGEQG